MRRPLATLLALALASAALVAQDNTIHKNPAAYSTQQTGAVVWAPAAAARKIVITSAGVRCGGTTAGVVRLWFGATADSTFTAGTDQTVLLVACDDTGLIQGVFTFETPILALTAGHELKITSSAAVTVEVYINGRER